MAAHDVRQRMRRQRSIFRIGLLLSLFVHLVFFLFFRTIPERLTLYAAAGPAAGDPIAAPGGGSMRSVVLKPRVEITIPKRPESPVIKPVEIEPTQEVKLSLSELVEPDLGQGNQQGPQSGEGLPGGEGGGDAGNAMEGYRRLIPPAPRGAIMTPLAHRPSSVRGREVTVWVFINSSGAVDSVRLETPTPDKKFNQLLTREAWDWVFEPARRAGVAVASWYSYTWKL